MKIILNIEGMMCGMCESHMNDAIRSAFNVKKVASSSKENKTVIITDKDISDEDLAQTVKKTGYELKGIKREKEEEKKGLFSIFKK